MLEFDFLVIGGGASGMTAAAAAAENGKYSVLLLESRGYLGGILPQCIHEGFGTGQTGPEYEKKIERRFLSSGAEYMLESTVMRIDDDSTALFSCRSGIFKVRYKYLLMATGCTEIPFGALGIAGTRPEGIYGAGQAQELINIRHKDLGDNFVILGCGDLGMVMTGQLASQGKNVAAVVERESSFTGTRRNYRKYIENNRIPVLFDSTIARVEGTGRIDAVVLDDGRTIKCDTLLIAAGLRCDTVLTDKLDDRKNIFFCGNCERVHDMVESAIIQSETTVNTILEAL